MNFIRKQNRLKKFDYSLPGYYFVTICAQNRVEYFGEILEGKMRLSEAGKVAHAVWLRSPVVYPKVEIGEFVVMPNHIHGILIINSNQQAAGLRYSLPQIIGSFKNVATKLIRNQIAPDFSWQASYYDHVIRKEESLDKIREYIRNNPVKWKLDRNNPENLWM